MRIAIVIGSALAGVVLGILAGLRLGERVRGRSRLYWTLNVLSFVAGGAVNFVGVLYGLLWLQMGALVLMGGLITGLKYGYAESIGLWRTHDTWMRNDEDLRGPSN